MTASPEQSHSMTQRFQTRPARAAPPPLSRVSAAVFAMLARKTKFMDPSLAESWPQLAGDRLAALCRPGRITGSRQGSGAGAGRTLEVHVASGAAAAEVQIQADDLMMRVNTFLGPGAISRIAVLQTGGGAPGAQSSRPSDEAASLDESGLGSALASFRAAIRRRNGGE